MTLNSITLLLFIFLSSLSHAGFGGGSRMQSKQMPLSPFAGNLGGPGFNDGIGSFAKFNSSYGLVSDASGTVYVTDTNNHTIRKITATGVVTTIAGVPGQPGTTDGTGSAARFNNPQGLKLDSAGNLFVLDSGNATLRKITPAGVVSTFAGTAGSSGSTNGTGTAAKFNAPQGLAIDSSDNIYVADSANNMIRKVTSAGVVTTFAGAVSPGTADGTGTAARFNLPVGIAIDSSGNLFVTDFNNHSIRKITSAGVVTTFAGLATFPGSINGTGTAAKFYYPYGIIVDGSNNLFVAEISNNTIRKITSAAVVTTVAGSFGVAGDVDATGTAANFSSPSGLAIDGSGILYVTDTSNSLIRKINLAGVVTTLAGARLIYGSTDGTGSAARFTSPGGLTVDSSGTIYVSDSNNSTIRKITPASVVTTFAGTAGSTGNVDGNGVAARFNNPLGIVVDSNGNLFVADNIYNTIRKITPAGVVTTFAGATGASGTTDGTGTAARFNSPFGMTIDSSNNLYVADSANHAIRKITPAGVVTTIAGTAGVSGSTNGTGTAAKFASPTGVAIDSSNNLYVTDRANQLIRKITSGAVVTTLAGTSGTSGYVDGTGTAAKFLEPYGITVDSQGNIYVAEFANQTIRKITSAGVVSTYLGVGTLRGTFPGKMPGGLSYPLAITYSKKILYIATENGIVIAPAP